MQFYEHDAALVEGVGTFLTPAFDSGEAAIVIATKPHCDGIEACLQARGIDVEGARSDGHYLTLDAAEALSVILVDGWPDARRFAEVVGGALIRAEAGGRRSRTRAFGEMVALLWAEGEREAALRLEELWEATRAKHSFSLLCGYPVAAFGERSESEYFNKVTAAHDIVVPAESYTSLSDPQDRLRVIAELQQKALALETEAAQRRAAEVELRRTIEQLAHIDRRKDEFLALLGHELRNPLAPVTSALELIRLHEDEPTRVARLRETIERQIGHMTRLIDDLLDVSRITRGKVQLRDERVSLSSVVANAIEIAHPLIEERGHRFELDLPDAPVTLIADPTRLAQVIANLLNNAAKYTDVGGHIRLAARTAGPELVLSVRDDGAGLTPELREHVFEMFVQGSERHTRQRGGLGIGLTLVKSLVDLHGGSVEALSDGAGLGSEFVVRLPIVADEATKSAPARSANGDGVLGPRRKVLVVDDNVDAAESLAELLREYGHDARTAHDGDTAIVEAERMRPDVVLLDIGLPLVDGYEVARRLRAHEGLNSTILVALTGFGEDRHRRLAREAGFDHHVTKPVDVSQLEDLLRLPL
ncbi:MAG TPA: ATP-binding protein [Candidatus Limnocylindria bacterium]|nr:ATP-binding protein [Candidatus Limnocylindria bacterium]